ncbi:MAG TPA: hypothetical protein VK641_08870, partial [Terriglobales bacterium]|nr:hypothetical protein [Terriglobales bacterium]
QEQQRQQEQQQQRDQQQRDQQQRYEQARQQEQQREQQQQRDEQQRQQQLRDQQQREQQERVPAHASNDSASISNVNTGVVRAPAAQAPAPNDKRVIPDTKTSDAARKRPSNLPPLKATAAKDPASIAPELGDRKVCDSGPCKTPRPKPIAPAPPRNVCKDGPCQKCPVGQSGSKDGSCTAPAVQAGRKAVDPQSCPAGQNWNGTQCAAIGAQQSGVGGSQLECTVATAGSQDVIARLRIAKMGKNEACGSSSNDDCQIMESRYNSVLSEYQGFLGGVPSHCRIVLPDPSTI